MANQCQKDRDKFFKILLINITILTKSTVIRSMKDTAIPIGQEWKNLRRYPTAKKELLTNYLVRQPRFILFNFI